MKTAKKEASLKITILVRKERNQYAALCPELDVASCAANIEEACQNLKEAVRCYLETYAELGELEKLLDERGISLIQEETCPKVFLAEASVEVPFAKTQVA